MAANSSNDLNSLSWLSLDQLRPSVRAKLLAMALNGDSIVNPLGVVADNDPHTPQGRARQEREEQEKRVYEALMAQLEERRAEFLHDLDRREQACIEALHENEEQLREARKELQKIRDRAYEITLPDGTLAKVYRDGDKVRMESGAEVSRDVVKAEDLGDKLPSWMDYRSGKDRFDQLEAQRHEIEKYQEKLRDTENRAKAGGLSSDEIDAANRQLNETMPNGVRRHSVSVSEPDKTDGLKDTSPKAGTASAPFTRAASRSAASNALSEKDFEAMRPPAPASGPAPM